VVAVAMLTTALLMCHAPIVIPDIGGERAGDCAATTAAMATAARLLAESGARRVVLLSPHAPRYARAYGYSPGERLRGDFGAFGRPEVACGLVGDPSGAAALGAACATAGLDLRAQPPGPLDHGATVPLWFLAQTGFRGPVLVLGLSAQATTHRLLGACLARALGGEPWALLASGDMSHALRPGGPAGYHPRAKAFDTALRACVGDLGALPGLDPNLRELACEDVVEVLEVAQGVLDGQARDAREISYEAPFGVGYLVAVLHAGAP
jgi:MEMO1 family protein